MGTQSSPLGSSYGGRIIKDDKNDRIYSTDANNVPVALMGAQPTFGQGFYVAKPGVNAATNTDPSQWIFNSNQDTFKVAKILTGSLAVDFNAYSSAIAGQFSQYSTSRLQIAHNLGFFPVIIPTVEITAGVYTPFSEGSLIGPGIVTNPIIETNVNYGIVAMAYFSWHISVDSYNAYIEGVESGGGGNSAGYSLGANNMGTFSFKIYCLQETAS